MQKGRIVYLSGLTSTGKSSIVKALQSRTDCLWCALGFDLFEETLPVWAADDSALYARAIRAMYAAAKSFSDQGLDVLIDGLLMDQPGLVPHGSAVEETFAGYPLTLVQVTCPLDVLRQRNIARGDRRPDQSELQAKLVDPNAKYHIVLDTSARTPEQCAQALLDALRQQHMT